MEVNATPGGASGSDSDAGPDQPHAGQADFAHTRGVAELASRPPAAQGRGHQQQRSTPLATEPLYIDVTQPEPAATSDYMDVRQTDLARALGGVELASGPPTAEARHHQQPLRSAPPTEAPPLPPNHSDGEGDEYSAHPRRVALREGVDADSDTLPPPPDVPMPPAPPARRSSLGDINMLPTADADEAPPPLPLRISQQPRHSSTHQLTHGNTVRTFDI